MSWHHLSDNPQWIDTLYGDAPPSLRGCRISKIGVHDPKDMSLTLHITHMPPELLWPNRWDKTCNRVTLELNVWAICALHVEGWSANNVADVEFCRADDGRSIALTASGEWGRVTATGRSLYIQHVQGYRVEDAAVVEKQWRAFIDEHLAKLNKLGVPELVYQTKPGFDQWLTRGGQAPGPLEFDAKSIKGARRFILASLIAAYLDAGFSDPGIVILSKEDWRRVRSSQRSRP